MKAALFGRRVDQGNIGRLHQFIGMLSRHADVELCYYRPFRDAVREFIRDLPSGSCFASYEDLPRDAQLFFSLGGDGTFLESIAVVRDRQIPIAGINFGRLGFLTTACVEEENPWLENILQGKFSVEDRTLLQLQKDRLPDEIYPYALNEITIQRSIPSMLELDVSINGNPLPKYWADGIMIASATGSTAYSMSIGGPVVTPDSKVLILAPIAPHNLNVRPLILPEDSVLELSYQGRNPDAVLTLDNRCFTIKPGEKIRVTKGGFPIRSVSVNNNFIAALNQKLLWGEDKRNMR